MTEPSSLTAPTLSSHVANCQPVSSPRRWSLAAGQDQLISPPLDDPNRLLDVAAGACIAIQLLAVARLVAMGPMAVWAEYQTANPPYAAGCMAAMGVGNWFVVRGARGFGTTVWVVFLCIMIIGQAVFLRTLWRKWSATPESAPKPKPDGAAPPAPPPPYSARRLWMMAQPLWILPLVGVSAASVTGGLAVRTSTSDFVTQCVALYGPVALGGLWGCVLILPLHAKAFTHKLFGDPTSAILMAPPALNLVGYLAAVGPNPTKRNDWPVHLLIVLVLLFSVRPIAALPPLLDPRKKFMPTIATTGWVFEGSEPPN